MRLLRWMTGVALAFQVASLACVFAVWLRLDDLGVALAQLAAGL